MEDFTWVNVGPWYLYIARRPSMWSCNEDEQDTASVAEVTEPSQEEKEPGQQEKGQAQGKVQDKEQREMTN